MFDSYELFGINHGVDNFYHFKFTFSKYSAAALSAPPLPALPALQLRPALPRFAPPAPAINRAQAHEAGAAAASARRLKAVTPSGRPPARSPAAGKLHKAAFCKVSRPSLAKLTLGGPPLTRPAGLQNRPYAKCPPLGFRSRRCACSPSLLRRAYARARCSLLALLCPGLKRALCASFFAG